MLDWNMNPQSALDMGHIVNRNGKTNLEEGTPAAELQAPLEALRHEVSVRALNSGLHAIMLKHGKPCCLYLSVKYGYNIDYSCLVY